MVLKLKDTYLSDVITEADYKSIEGDIKRAHDTLYAKNGPGNDFLGWRTASCSYDKEEFARIKEAAKKIQKKAIRKTLKKTKKKRERDGKRVCSPRPVTSRRKGSKWLTLDNRKETTKTDIEERSATS